MSGLTEDWRVARHTFARNGEWEQPLRAVTDDSTVRIYDMHDKLVLIIGLAPVDAFAHIGNPPRLMLDPKID